MKENCKEIHQRRQCGGGGIMIWGMITPNGLLSITKLVGKINSDKYVDMLSYFAVRYIKLNMKNNYGFVQDNCKIHTTEKVKELLKNQGAKIIKWPSRSPDINIIENVWKMVSDIVYENGQSQNLRELEFKIFQAVDQINNEKRHLIENLYDSYIKRLTRVLICNGSVYK